MKKFIFGLALALVLASAGSASAATYTRDLTLGATGADVVELQSMLVAGGHLVMPAGVSMGYFGTLTQSAVAKWQAANGIAPAVGYFGPISRAKASMVVTTTPSTPSTTLEGGDGDFSKYSVLGTPSSEDIEEGQSVKVYGVEFTPKDSDLELQRVEVTASSTSGTVTKPWKVLEEVAIFVGSKKVADVDASDADNWDETANGSNVYTIKLNDLDTVVREGSKTKMYVEVTAQDSLDTDELGDWDISVTSNGLRALNAEGVNVYEGSATTKSFTLTEADAGDVTITVNSNDNKDRTVSVDDENDTNDVDAYIAEVKSKTGDNEVESVDITLASPSGETLADMVSTVYLFIDGEEVGSESAAATVTFDDLSVVIDEDDTVDFEVKFDLNDTNGGVAYQNNDTVRVTGMTVDYVDQNDDDASEVSTTDGGILTLSTSTIAVEFKSAKIVNVAPAPTSGSGSAVEAYEITFEVTAMGDEDMYISYATTTAYSVISSGGTIVEESVTLDASDSDDDDDSLGNYFIVRHGENNSRTFTYTVTLSATSTASAKVVMDAIGYGDTVLTASSYTENISDFKTGTKTIIVR